MSAPAVATTSPWSPLRVRVFRDLWLASVVSNVGTMMHTVAAAWAMTELSDSSTVVSLVQTAWAIPGFLVAVPAGAMADVVDRRRLIVVSQAVSMLFAAGLGVLALTDRLDIPLLLLGTFLLSVVLTLSAPAFMALLPDLVGPEELTQAIGMNNVSYNGSQSVGPALAGVIIAASGAGAVFLINAASFLGIVWVMWRYRPTTTGPTSTESMKDAMRTGVTYFVRRPELRRYAARFFLAFVAVSAVIALLPVVARQHLDTSAGQYGVMAAAIGVGAVFAVWLVPRAKAALGPNTLVLAAAVVWCTGVVLIAATHSIPVAVVGVLLAGIGAMAQMNVVYSMFMLLLPGWIRGRASSVVMLTVWLAQSLGAVAWGALADGVGVTTALLAAGAFHLCATGAVTTWARLGDATNPIADDEPAPVPSPE